MTSTNLQAGAWFRLSQSLRLFFAHHSRELHVCIALRPLTATRQINGEHTQGGAMNYLTKFNGCMAAATALWLLAVPAHAALRASGTLLDHDGQPVAGVMVRVWDVNPGRDDNIVLGEAATDARGQFSIRYRNHSDPGPFNTQPDIRITVETPARYSTGNWFDRPGMATFATVGTRNDAGENTILAWWPGFDQQVNDYDVTRDINLLPGMLIVERNRWESVRTGFDPLLHGFNFPESNAKFCWGPTCHGDWGPIFSTKQTLCGGMSLTVLKKYVAGRCDTYTSYAEVPKENEDGNRLPPALKQEIVTNQIETFTNDPYVSASNLDANLSQLTNRPPPNFPGLRFLDWQQKQEIPGSTPGASIGAATKSQWPLIRDHLRLRKLPAILGLVHAHAQAMIFLDVDLLTTNHQVLAIGYDFNPHYRTGTLYIYDPNYPGQIRELRFKEQLRHSLMYIDYDARKTRGFFLNVGAPADARPPTVRCPLPVRQQNLQLTHLEIRDATALDMAAPKHGAPWGVFARVKNVGADPVSGQVRVECGAGATGETITSFAYQASESVQLASGERQWLRVGMPASTEAAQRSVSCQAVLNSAQKVTPSLATMYLVRILRCWPRGRSLGR